MAASSIKLYEYACVRVCVNIFVVACDDDDDKMFQLFLATREWEGETECCETVGSVDELLMRMVINFFKWDNFWVFRRNLKDWNCLKIHIYWKFAQIFFKLIRKWWNSIMRECFQWIFGKILNFFKWWNLNFVLLTLFGPENTFAFYCI